MPLYDYQCQDCQKTFEVRATLKEKEAGLQPQCPHCHSLQTRQLLTSGLFLRKGSDSSLFAAPVCGPTAGPGCCGS
ncbi:zinc ribbon domain-containing protein [uncultured Chloroflexus sp.]|uniref:FmdB family zinc ribbon protein n=1 Tax=uncultured Chloroflexus sp. TaxID=214040 RepID=UPI0034562A41